jgi:histidine ammonia-lyase
MTVAAGDNPRPPRAPDGFAATGDRFGDAVSCRPMTADALMLDGGALTIDAVESVARQGRPVALANGARRHIDAARAVVDRCAAGEEAVYGLNTGFGSLAHVRIGRDELRQVQRNLLRSHAAGVGEPLAGDVVRAMMLITAANLARGNSGVRVDVIEAIIALLNRGVTPIVPMRGSVGASGDLAPLAHAALVIIGEGEAIASGRRMNGAEALQAAALRPLELQAREGLALINGTHLMCAIGALAMADVSRLMDAGLLAAAMAIDACRATDASLDDRLHVARRQPGQRRVAALLRQHLAGSTIIPAHRENDPRVQDPYCLRAAPQVLGAAMDAIEWVRGVFERELGAVTDNPLVFPVDAASPGPGAGRSAERSGAAIVSGGNFHGMPLAIAADVLTIALCHIAGIAERRIYWLLAATDRENPVNLHLSPKPGLHSGLMIVQYTAAACCNELQSLAHPASVGNIPTCAGIEDYNSMGATAGHQARAAVELATSVIACELLVMAEAMEYQRPLRSGEGVERAYAAIRRAVPRLTEDRPPAPDIAAIARLIRGGLA